MKKLALLSISLTLTVWTEVFGVKLLVIIRNYETDVTTARRFKFSSVQDMSQEQNNPVQYLATKLKEDFPESTMCSYFVSPDNTRFDCTNEIQELLDPLEKLADTRLSIPSSAVHYIFGPISDFNPLLNMVKESKKEYQDPKKWPSLLKPTTETIKSPLLQLISTTQKEYYRNDTLFKDLITFQLALFQQKYNTNPEQKTAESPEKLDWDSFVKNLIQQYTTTEEQEKEPIRFPATELDLNSLARSMKNIQKPEILSQLKTKPKIQKHRSSPKKGQDQPSGMPSASDNFSFWHKLSGLSALGIGIIMAWWWYFKKNNPVTFSTES